MKLYFVLTCVLLMSACAGMAAHNQISSALQREGDAWNRVTAESQAKCPSTKTRAKALEVNACVNKLVDLYVRPVSTNPIGLDKFVSVTKRAALNYKKGKIDSEEADLLIAEAMTRYKSEIIAMADNSMMMAQQQDMMASQRMQAMSQQMNQQTYQSQQQVIQPNPIRTTNCRNMGGSIQCTTW